MSYHFDNAVNRTANTDNSQIKNGGMGKNIYPTSKMFSTICRKINLDSFRLKIENIRKVVRPVILAGTSRLCGGSKKRLISIMPKMRYFIVAIIILPFSYISAMGQGFYAYNKYDYIRFIGSINFSPRVLNSVYSLKTQELKSPKGIENTEGFTIQANAGILVPTSPLIAVAITPNFSYSDFGEKIALNSITSFGLNIGGVITLPATNSAFTHTIGWGPKWFLFNATEDNTLPHHQYIEYLADGARFGSSYYQSIGIDFFNTFAVSARFERTFVAPRFVFGKELGNGIITSTLVSVPNTVINSLTHEVPALGFVLGTLYQYGVTQIIKKNKSWPFDTPSPVTMDEISFGVTIKL